MTISEILTGQGVTTEQAEKILATMKENKIYVAGEENLDIRYGKLKTDHAAKTAELTQANGLIAQLKAASQGTEGLQEELQRLKQENESMKTDYALRVALLEADAADVDYLAYKLKEKGNLELDEKGKLEGVEEKIAGLKTQFPSQFAASRKQSRIEENKLPESQGANTDVTAERFQRMGYQDRLKLYQADPERYQVLTGDNTSLKQGKVIENGRTTN